MFKKQEQTVIIPRPTPWADEAKKPIPLADYPRPQLQRSEWMCLNGPWLYAVRADKKAPDTWDGEIIVPYSPESMLSGAKKAPGIPCGTSGRSISPKSPRASGSCCISARWISAAACG